MSRTEGVQDRDPVSPLMWTYRKVWLQSSGWADCTSGLLSSVKRRGPERTERGQTSALWRRLHQPASLKRNSANLNNNFFLNSTTSSPLLTLQACPSSLSALWASVGFWMTRPPAFPEKSIATRLASDFDCTHTHTHRESKKRHKCEMTPLNDFPDSSALHHVCWSHFAIWEFASFQAARGRLG